MSIKLIAKDDFPRPAAAPWLIRQEAHETITAACHREAVRARLSRLIATLGQPANSNAPSPQVRSGTTS
jgi:hypothetical protein